MSGQAYAAECTDLEVRYENGDYGLRGVSLSFPVGTSTAVCGVSGSGKSTLLAAIAGLIQPSDGEVQVGGVVLGDLTAGAVSKIRRTQIGTVFQQGHLLPELNGLDNVALPLRLNGLGRKAARARADVILDALGLQELAGKMPWQLSGGQRQRVAVARAIVTKPALILADEPTGSLDHDNALVTLETITRSAQAVSGTLILITHDQELARSCERIVHLADGRVRSDSLVA